MDCPLNEIELMFYESAQSIPGLTPQYWIAKYRVDFCIPDKMIVIEIDGKQFHGLRRRIFYDRPRQKELERLGYTVIRFTGTEVYRDAAGCARRVRRWIWVRSLISKRRHDIMELIKSCSERALALWPGRKQR